MFDFILFVRDIEKFVEGSKLVDTGINLLKFGKAKFFSLRL